MTDNEDKPAYYTEHTIRQHGIGSIHFYHYPHSLDMEYTIFSDEQGSKILQNGTFAELIELILLGKSRKAQFEPRLKLQAESKKEPIMQEMEARLTGEPITPKCDLCGKSTTGQNPHYDCEQREAYLADSIRELQNNG